jgi:hypothetical protein
MDLSYPPIKRGIPWVFQWNWIWMLCFLWSYVISILTSVHSSFRFLEHVFVNTYSFLGRSPLGRSESLSIPISDMIGWFDTLICDMKAQLVSALWSSSVDWTWWKLCQVCSNPLQVRVLLWADISGMACGSGDQRLNVNSLVWRK